MTDGDGSIALSWTPRTTELADAQLARYRELGGPSARGVVAVLLALFAAPMLVSPSTFWLAVPMFAMALFLVWMRLTATMMRRQWALLVAGNPAIGEPVVGRLDTSGVRTDGARVSTLRSWSAFTSWSDAPGAFVLATSDNRHGAIVVVPHRAASGPDDVTAIRVLAEQQLGPSLGSGPGRAGRRWWPWVARAVVLSLLIVPVVVTMSKVHHESAEWRLWPTQSPPLVSYDGLDFRRTGGATPHPDGVAGVAYTSGGGLILEPFPRPPELTDIWVLDHDNVVHHYITADSHDG